MKTRLRILTLALTLVPGAVLGSELMIYPNEGQDADQQEMDNFQCYGWAKGESGFDPMAPPTATEPPPQQEARKGGVARGALRGAAVGGIIDGSDGAKTGAAAGAVGKVGGAGFEYGGATGDTAAGGDEGGERRPGGAAAPAHLWRVGGPASGGF